MTTYCSLELWPDSTPMHVHKIYETFLVFIGTVYFIFAPVKCEANGILFWLFSFFVHDHSLSYRSVIRFATVMEKHGWGGGGDLVMENWQQNKVMKNEQQNKVMEIENILKKVVEKSRGISLMLITNHAQEVPIIPHLDRPSAVIQNCNVRHESSHLFDSLRSV